MYDIYYVFDCLQTAPNGNIGGIIEDEFIVGRSRCGGWTRGCKYDITGCHGGILVWNHVFSDDSSAEKGAEKEGGSG